MNFRDVAELEEPVRADTAGISTFEFFPHFCSRSRMVGFYIFK